jgi:hypothetical protein
MSGGHWKRAAKGAATPGMAPFVRSDSLLNQSRYAAEVQAGPRSPSAAALVAHSFLQVARSRQGGRCDQTTLTLPEAEKLLGETLAAYDRSPRTVETHTLMLDLFSRYLKRVCPERPAPALRPHPTLRHPRRPQA